MSIRTRVAGKRARLEQVLVNQQEMARTLVAIVGNQRERRDALEHSEQSLVGLIIRLIHSGALDWSLNLRIHPRHDMSRHVQMELEVVRYGERLTNGCSFDPAVAHFENAGVQSLVVYMLERLVSSLRKA